MAGPSGSIQGPAEAKWGYTTLSVADWDARRPRRHPRQLDLAEADQLLRNTERRAEPAAAAVLDARGAAAFYWWQTLAENLQTQWRTTPVAVDFDGDGELDLVILDQQGYLSCQSRARPRDAYLRRR